MAVSAGQAAEYLNFVAKLHRMPRYPWQCLNFLGTGQVSRERLPEPTTADALLLNFQPVHSTFCPYRFVWFLILIARFVIL